MAFLDRKFPNEPNYKASLVALWRKYLELGLPNAHFVSEFTNGKKESIFQRAWEMMIARHLDALGYHITNLEVGPDFRFERDGKTIWVEAISPEPKGLPEHWMTRPKADEFKVGDFPHNEILLRWTAAIKEKWQKLLDYQQKKIVAGSDAYVSALNGCQLGALPVNHGITRYPFAVEAVYPVGPLAYEDVLATPSSPSGSASRIRITLLSRPQFLLIRRTRALAPSWLAPWIAPTRPFCLWI